jgi:hypothetical protein
MGTSSTTRLSAGHDSSVNKGDPDDAGVSIDVEAEVEDAETCSLEDEPDEHPAMVEAAEAWSLDDSAEDEPDEHPAIEHVRTNAATKAIRRLDIMSSFSLRSTALL